MTRLIKVRYRVSKRDASFKNCKILSGDTEGKIMTSNVLAMGRNLWETLYSYANLVHPT